MKQTNYIYIYDGRFDSLLKLIDKLIQNNIKPLNIKDNNFEDDLFDETINLELDDLDIYKNIINRVDITFLKVMYYVFLSNNENKELILYYLYLNSFKYNKHILKMRNLKCVSKALEISSYVSRENHKMKGFLRFKELDNKVLYAEIEPTNNIIELLSNHFKNRLKNEYWIIKDIKRNIVSIYDKNNFYLINGDNINIDVSCTNNSYEEMWKLFYKHIGIKDRKNDRCRNNFMPKKYWKNMLEVSDEL